MSLIGRFCCKSLFALAIKMSFGCTGDFHVNLRGPHRPKKNSLATPVTSLRPHRSAVVGRIFYSRKISAGQFRTFATISALSVISLLRSDSVAFGCEADMRTVDRSNQSDVNDPQRSLGSQICCDAQRGI